MNIKDNLLVGVSVFYYPSQSAIENVIKYINSVDKLIIWDNTPSEFQKYNRFDFFQNNDKIILMSDGINRGTAYAYNKAAQWGLANNYEYLLIMDQDGTWEDFDLYRKEALDYLHVKTDAIITPNINKKTSFCIQEIDTSWCIASGMLFSLAMYSIIGLFEENLFVEGVDIDYCLRAKILNIKIIRCSKGILHQQFGNKIYSPLFRCYSRNDSPQRTYNIILNQIRIFKKYKKYVHRWEVEAFVKSFIIKRFVQIILFEKEKIKKCYMIISASFSGIFNMKIY